MTLTVRLDDSLEAALVRYCADHGVSKSLVVQESLAVYLVAKQASPSGLHAKASGGAAPKVSAAYQALATAGLIGGGELGGASADKAAVRERATQRIRSKTT